VTESKFALLFVLKPQSNGLFEILICESLVQEAVDEHHQIQRQSCLSLHVSLSHNPLLNTFSFPKSSVSHKHTGGFVLLGRIRSCSQFLIIFLGERTGWGRVGRRSRDFEESEIDSDSIPNSSGVDSKLLSFVNHLVPCRPPHSSSRVKLLNSGKKHPLSSLSTKLFFTRQRPFQSYENSDLKFPEQQTAAPANSAPKPDSIFNVFYFILKSKDLVLSQFIKLLSRGSEEVSSAMSRIVDSVNLNTRTGTESDSHCCNC
jgi:hypothetical protein